jgi:hypothetical protein
MLEFVCPKVSSCRYVRAIERLERALDRGREHPLGRYSVFESSPLRDSWDAEEVVVDEERETRKAVLVGKLVCDVHSHTVFGDTDRLTRGRVLFERIRGGGRSGAGYASLGGIV